MRFFVLAAVVLLLVPVALGQEGETVIVSGPPAPTLTGELGLFETISGDTVGKGNWTFGAYYDVSRFVAGSELVYNFLEPHVIRRSYDDMAVEQNRATATIGYGLTDRWDLSLSIPYLDLENRADDRWGFVNGRYYQGKFTDGGPGYARLATKIGLGNRDEGAPRWALTAFYGFEIDDEPSAVTSGEDTYGAGVAFTHGIFNASLGYEQNDGEFLAEDFIGVFVYEVSEKVRADFGIDLELAAFQGTRWLTEINTVWYHGGSVDDPDDSISVTTGIRKTLGTSGWAMSAAVRNNVTAMLSNDDTKGFGFILGFHYGPLYYVTLPPPPVKPPPPVPVPIPVPVVEQEPEPIAAPAGPVGIMKQTMDFTANSARTTNIAKAVLDDIALRMREEPASTLMITGYATALELSNDSNIDRRRAESTRDFLTSRHGIDQSRISIEAGGEGEKTVKLELVVP